MVELRDLAHDLANALLTGFPAGDLRDAVERVVRADGVVAVTPTFNASYSGLFKSFFDVLEPGALTGKPVLLGATGGTARHSLVLDHAMRPLFAYLQSLVVPTGVYAASADWGSGGTCRERTAAIGSTAPQGSSPPWSCSSHPCRLPTRTPTRRRSRACSRVAEAPGGALLQGDDVVHPHQRVGHACLVVRDEAEHHVGAGRNVVRQACLPTR